MFVDESKINVKGGDGGAGCKSFRREAHVPRGGPDGGNGGNGGDVVLQGDPSLSSLVDYKFKRHFKADRGIHGKGSQMHGANGEDIILKVPLGTIARDSETGEMLADITQPGERVVLARGGRGGRGNIQFVTPTRRAPAFAELGEPTYERWMTLEMKLMADAALVGFPSVGKSSLIARISAAKPKIADYPFTTLVPNLGVVRAGEYSFVVADVPGLIEGASEGKGLGHAFLRHIERSAAIVHMVDLTGGYEQRDVVDDLAVITNELERHAQELADRPTIIVGNKIDMPGTAEASERLAARCAELGLTYFAISTITGQGIDPLVLHLGNLVHDLRLVAAEDAQTYEKVYVPAVRSRDRTFEVQRTGSHAFEVTGRGIERMVIMTEMQNEEALAYLQRRFSKIGLEKALQDAGAQDGDDITIAAITFEFEGVGAVEDVDDVEDFDDAEEAVESEETPDLEESAHDAESDSADES